MADILSQDEIDALLSVPEREDDDASEWDAPARIITKHEWPHLVRGVWVVGRSVEDYLSNISIPEGWETKFRGVHYEGGDRAYRLARASETQRDLAAMRQPDRSESQPGLSNIQQDVPAESVMPTDEESSNLTPREKLAIVAQRIEVLGQQNDLLKAENEPLRVRLEATRRVLINTDIIEETENGEERL